MNKIIIIDWNGTLIRKNILDRATVLRGESISSDENHKESLKKFSGIMDEELLTIELTHLLNVYYMHMVNLEGEEIFYPEVLKYLNKWSAGGYKLFIVSNMWKRTVETTLELMGISHLFEGIYGNTQNLIYDKKSLIEMIITDVGKPCIYIGDDVEDVDAAKKTGIKSGIVTWGRPWTWDDYPEYLMDTFHEVNNLIELYEDLKEI
ncbi:HAD-IA family hydrolase [Candidatus Micrarchaeota archaeon]|nr:HAD-IA family hydrolase [Candidatus Micrarchaeota archaeon]